MEIQNGTQKKTPYLFYLLVFLLAFESIAALAGGLMLLYKPDGSIFGFPTIWLAHSPFSSYAVPGFVQAFLLGIYPLVVMWGLLEHPRLRFMGWFSFSKKIHWSWAHCFYVNVVLLAWTILQLYWAGLRSPLQFIPFVFGIGIGLLALHDSVRTHCFLPDVENTQGLL